MDIYKEILSALHEEERVMLATIIHASGSTPVATCSKMLLKQGARIPVGTVGGGCVESEVQDEARRLFETGSLAAIHRFVLTEDDLESGMLCGGNIDVLIEPIGRDQIPFFSALKAVRDTGEDSIVVTVLYTEHAVAGRFLLSPYPHYETGEGTQVAELGKLVEILPASFADTVHDAHRHQEIMRLPCGSGSLLIEPVYGTQGLVVFGGGHVSKFVSRVAAVAGFQITVVDDRIEYANPERFPEAFETFALPFDEAFERLTVKPSTSLVIVTRGHKCDEDVLLRAVYTEARYIGMIGSKRKVALTYERLMQRGVPASLLQKVHSPIGLNLGARTAEEIGVAIAAELIAARRGALQNTAQMSAGMEFFFKRQSTEH